MLNDRQASELISRSMHGPLTEAQQRQVDEYLEEHGKRHKDDESKRKPEAFHWSFCFRSTIEFEGLYSQ